VQRFFLPELTPKQDQVVSLAPIHSQLRRVLRVQPGAQVIVLDNAGSERVLQVESVERRDTLARVMEVRPAPAEPAVALTLYQCVLKGDKFEFVLQKATELGATTVVPVVSSRTVARPGRALAHKQTRWEAIVREAAEQCGRGALPVVAPACSFADALAAAQGTRLLPWEEGEANPGLVAALQQSPQPVAEVNLLIGPEGGLEAGEIEEAIAAGWQVVTLGQRILRAETAALASLALVTAALGWMGDAATVQVASGTRSKLKSANVDNPSQENDATETAPEKGEMESSALDKAASKEVSTHAERPVKS
jgi:16S rRNA (uracil1498-N3)-methyltransferase